MANDSKLVTLTTAIEHAWPAERWRDCGVIVGCSGGADSVALAVGLAAVRDDCNHPQRARGFLKLVHVNHGLRGTASDGDEQFVSELAQRLGIEFHAERLSDVAADEASLRAARESIFSAHAHAIGARYVAVGHTADDNAETVLHHLFRGTGPAGLSGIAPFRPLGADVVLVRPLLNLRRDAIRQTLRDHHIDWREDASNLDTHYTRNWIRHDLMPGIQSRYPDVVDRLSNTVELQRQWRLVIEQQAETWLAAHQLHSSPQQIQLRRNSKAERVVVVAALQELWRQNHWPRNDMTIAHWTQLAETICDQAACRMTLPGAIDVVADNECVTLRRASC